MAYPVMLQMEVLYFLAVVAFCLFIYIKTSDAFSLTRLRGIFHFRNIFLYFSLAYLFRLIYIFIMLGYGIDFVVGPFNAVLAVIFILIGYFSTMAIFSIAMTVLTRRIENDRKITMLMNMAAVLLSVLSFLIMTFDYLVVFQLFIFSAAMVFVLRDPVSKHSITNKVTYLSLFAFWIINLFDLGRGMFSFLITTTVHVISVLIFLSIYVRVEKRLKHAEKKKPSRNHL